MQKLILILLLSVVTMSCTSEGTDVSNTNSRTNNASNSSTTVEATPMLTPTPTPFDPSDINGKIGLADVSFQSSGCLRTKNGSLSEGQPVAVVLSIDEPPQKVIGATVGREHEKSCARYASEIGDHNPGKNYYYELKMNDPDAVESFDVGIAVIVPAEKVVLEKGSAHIDLDGDGKPESFRECTGNEGTLFSIWNGMPLSGKRIWESFYYVDYDTVPTCTDKDSAGIDEGDE